MKRLGTVLFLVLLVIFNSVQANAEAISETIENQQNTIISTFVEHGVNETVAINLAAKIERGELLDSMKFEYQDWLPDYETYLGNQYIARYTYPDGSIKDISITAVQYNGTISGGSYSSGTQWFGWSNAIVSATDYVLAMSFTASMSGSVDSGVIQSVSGGSITPYIGGSTISNMNLMITQQNAVTGNPAKARLAAQYSYNSSGNITYALWLQVPSGAGPSAFMRVG